MSSEQSKRNAMELVADILQDLEGYKAEADGRIQQVYLDNGINDKMVQRAVKKAAQARVKRKTEEVKAEADEVSQLCTDEL
jgi:hypothetical protein